MEATITLTLVRAEILFQSTSFLARIRFTSLSLTTIVEGGHTKYEASQVIPWFKQAFVREGQTVLKGRWLAVHPSGNKVCYAQWEDCGPFRTDHWRYVFGDERPRPNLNQGAGLDVSPAVRDYLGLGIKDACDWKFVEFREVPPGPWATYGDNNTFVLLRRQSNKQFAAK